jgi:hypothetical protein
MKHQIVVVSSLTLALALAGSAGLAAEHEHKNGSQEQASQGLSSAQQAGQSSEQASKQVGTSKRRVGDMTGMAVVNRQGKRMGDVDKVVRRNEDGQPYAVISVGGFLGIGDKNIAVALDELRLKDEKVVLPDDLRTKAALEGESGWDRSKYKEIEASQQIDMEQADFAAFESEGKSGSQ